MTATVLTFGNKLVVPCMTVYVAPCMGKVMNDGGGGVFFDSDKFVPEVAFVHTGYPGDASDVGHRAHLRERAGGPVHGRVLGAVHVRDRRRWRRGEEVASPGREVW